MAGYAESIQTVFLIAVPIAALAFLATWLIPQVELRQWATAAPPPAAEARAAAVDAASGVDAVQAMDDASGDGECRRRRSTAGSGPGGPPLGARDGLTRSPARPVAAGSARPQRTQYHAPVRKQDLDSERVRATCSSRVLPGRRGELAGGAPELTGSGTRR